MQQVEYWILLTANLDMTHRDMAKEGIAKIWTAYKAAVLIFYPCLQCLSSIVIN